MGNQKPKGTQNVDKNVGKKKYGFFDRDIIGVITELMWVLIALAVLGVLYTLLLGS